MNYGDKEIIQKVKFLKINIPYNSIEMNKKFSR